MTWSLSSTIIWILSGAHGKELLMSRLKSGNVRTSHLPRLSVSYAYQLLMIVMSIYAVVGIGAEAVLPLGVQARRVLEIADQVLCAVFFLDFIWTMRATENKARYFFTWGWLDLVSSVPAIGFLRTARLVRVIRILRLLRGLRGARILAELLLRQRQQTTLVAVFLVCFSLVVFSSLAVLGCEPGQGGHIDSAGDALWWALSTMATVGYGDVYPVTFEGRAIAVVLMSAGVGLFATMSGLIASWLLDHGGVQSRAEVEELRAAVKELRAATEEFRRGRASEPSTGKLTMTTSIR
jgi:voltage-gated potassium channel